MTTRRIDPPKGARKAETWRRDRWQHLADFEVHSEEYVLTYDLDCATCDESDCVGRAYGDVPPVAYDGWPACPVYLIRSPWWQAVVRLWNAAQVSPLSDWPSAYAVWTVEAITALEAAAQSKGRESGK